MSIRSIYNLAANGIKSIALTEELPEGFEAPSIIIAPHEIFGAEVDCFMVQKFASYNLIAQRAFSTQTPVIFFLNEPINEAKLAMFFERIHIAALLYTIDINPKVLKYIRRSAKVTPENFEAVLTELGRSLTYV